MPTRLVANQFPVETDGAGKISDMDITANM